MRVDGVQHQSSAQFGRVCGFISVQRLVTQKDVDVARLQSNAHRTKNPVLQNAKQKLRRRKVANDLVRHVCRISPPDGPASREDEKIAAGTALWHRERDYHRHD